MKYTINYFSKEANARSALSAGTQCARSTADAPPSKRSSTECEVNPPLRRFAPSPSLLPSAGGGRALWPGKASSKGALNKLPRSPRFMTIEAK